MNTHPFYLKTHCEWREGSKGAWVKVEGLCGAMSPVACLHMGKPLVFGLSMALLPVGVGRNACQGFWTRVSFSWARIGLESRRPIGRHVQRRGCVWCKARCLGGKAKRGVLRSCLVPCYGNMITEVVGAFKKGGGGRGGARVSTARREREGHKNVHPAG